MRLLRATGAATLSPAGLKQERRRQRRLHRRRKYVDRRGQVTVTLRSPAGRPRGVTPRGSYDLHRRAKHGRRQPIFGRDCLAGASLRRVVAVDFNEGLVGCRHGWRGAEEFQ